MPLREFASLKKGVDLKISGQSVSFHIRDHLISKCKKITIPKVDKPTLALTKRLKQGTAHPSELQLLPPLIKSLAMFDISVFDSKKLVFKISNFRPNIEAIKKSLPKKFILKTSVNLNFSDSILTLIDPTSEQIVSIDDFNLLGVFHGAQKRKGLGTEKVSLFLNWLNRLSFLSSSNSTKKFSKYWEKADEFFHLSNRMTDRQTGRVNPHLKAIDHLDQHFRSGLPAAKKKFILSSHKTEPPNRQSLRKHSTVRNISLSQITQVLNQLRNGYYPSAGKVYENGIYLVVNKCQGLEKGVFAFNKNNNSLEKIETNLKYVRSLLMNASSSWGIANGVPQILIVITTKLPLLSARYQGISYRLSLLNAGVILGRLDQLCTRFRLAGCALGNGDSYIFEKVIRKSFYEETSIAEFAIGVPE